MALSYCKSLSVLFRRITSNHMGDFIAQIVFILTLQKINLKSIICKNHDYCYLDMPKEDNKILKYNNGESSIYYLC